MKTLVLLMALAFWSVVWGLPGAFLSTPLTTVMMVVLVQFQGTRWIAVMLSADGQPGELRSIPPHATPDTGPTKPASKRRSKSSPQKEPVRT